MAPTSPLVSIVIPCFNHARYLAAALDSIHRQSWTRIETIVLDDGSTDDSAAVAAAHGATIVRRQPNRGLAHARNAGLALARGEFVIFLDADDELMPDAVSSGLEVLRREPQAGCVVRRCQVMNEHGVPVPFTQTPLETSDLYREFLHCNFVWTPGAAMFRTDLVRSLGGFAPKAAAAADYALLLHCARQGLVVSDPREVIRYRKHSGNMSGDPVLMLRHVLKVLDDETEHLPPRYRDAWIEGRRRWRTFYGDLVFRQLRAEWRGARRPMRLAAGAMFFIQQCPRDALTHMWRKTLRLVRGLPGEPDEPGGGLRPVADADDFDTARRA